MRFSTLLSFLLAIVLAGLAVFGAQNFIAEQSARNGAAPAAEEAAPKRTIVIAAEEIALGERLNSSKLREIEWPAEVAPAGSFETIDTLITGDSDDVARYAISTISSGEPILNSRVTEPGVQSKMSTQLADGMYAASIRVNDVNGVAGFVLPGDRVDIWLRRDNHVDTLLQGIKVLAIDQISDDRKDKPSVVRTVTVEVTSQQSKKLVLAASVGEMSLALRNLASNDVELDETRITVGDLTEFDANKEIVAAKLEEVEVAVEEGPDPQEDLIAKQEALLKSFADNLTKRIDGVERKIKPAEPVIVEKVVEKVIEAPVIVPRNSTIAVIRNGQRAEYKVKSKMVLVENSVLDDDDLEEVVATE